MTFGVVNVNTMRKTPIPTQLLQDVILPGIVASGDQPRLRNELWKASTKFGVEWLRFW